METAGIRINKYLSEAGICSRREADRQIEAGNVTIDGKVAAMGDRILAGQKVCYHGREVISDQQMILLAVHKPVGIVCTAEKREKHNIVDFINYPTRIYPVGRLDKDSSGLILMTNQGDIVNKMMRAGNMHEKEYIVTVNREVTDAFLRGMAGGVPLRELGTTTRKCRVERLGKHKFRIILTQGLNRQIRRMCEYFGYRVRELERIRVMNIELGDLPEGKYRDVTEAELSVLYRMIEHSSNETVYAMTEQSVDSFNQDDKVSRDKNPNNKIDKKKDKIRDGKSRHGGKQNGSQGKNRRTERNTRVSHR